MLRYCLAYESPLKLLKMRNKPNYQPMSNERYLWYKKEIERLRKLDTLITNRVRATYSIKNKN